MGSPGAHFGSKLGSTKGLNFGEFSAWTPEDLSSAEAFTVIIITLHETG